MLLTNLSSVELIGNSIAELIANFTAPFKFDNQELTTSISVGVAIYPEDGADFETLLKKADMAMYRALFHLRVGECFHAAK